MPNPDREARKALIETCEAMECGSEWITSRDVIKAAFFSENDLYRRLGKDYTVAVIDHQTTRITRK